MKGIDRVRAQKLFFSWESGIKTRGHRFKERGRKNELEPYVYLFHKGSGSSMRLSG